MVNLCSNNYVGLCDEPSVMQAVRDGVDRYGAGTSSVRFICGTFTIHRELEEGIADFLGTEASITYTSCWNANEGLFAPVLGEEDVLISDALNHASIIDGIRLCKAQRKIYRHMDMDHLREVLEASRDARHRAVITDGVFSMEGEIAPLPEIRELCDRFDAIMVIDDSHATGVLGETGRGTPEHFGMHGEVDIVTSTLGKALGGMAVESHPELVSKLKANTDYFRERLLELGYRPIDGDTPIVPVIIGETSDAIALSNQLLAEGVFVIGFGFPVVPKGEARIRCQISASHEREHLDRALDALKKVGGKLGLI